MSSRELVPALTSWMWMGASGIDISVSRYHKSSQHTCEAVHNQCIPVYFTALCVLVEQWCSRILSLHPVGEVILIKAYAYTTKKLDDQKIKSEDMAWLQAAFSPDCSRPCSHPFCSRCTSSCRLQQQCGLHGGMGPPPGPHYQNTVDTAPTPTYLARE